MSGNLEMAIHTYGILTLHMEICAGLCLLNATRFDQVSLFNYFLQCPTNYFEISQSFPFILIFIDKVAKENMRLRLTMIICK